TVTVTSLGGAVQSDTTQVKVNDAPILGIPAAPIQSTVGQTVSGVLGSFREYDLAPVTDFTGIVRWADGTTTPATITAGPNGTFVVSSSNVLTQPGSQTAVVEIHDVGNPGKPGRFTVGFNV